MACNANFYRFMLCCIVVRRDSELCLQRVLNPRIRYDTFSYGHLGGNEREAREKR